VAARRGSGFHSAGYTTARYSFGNIFNETAARFLAALLTELLQLSNILLPRRPGTCSRVSVRVRARSVQTFFINFFFY
jgi:hypothetical protein